MSSVLVLRFPYSIPSCVLYFLTRFLRAFTQDVLASVSLFLCRGFLGFLGFLGLLGLLELLALRIISVLRVLSVLRVIRAIKWLILAVRIHLVY